MVESSDLHRYGYTIRDWLRLADGHQVVEYHARMPGSQHPRITVSEYADQCRVHRALGVACGPRGAQWVDSCPQTLPGIEEG